MLINKKGAIKLLDDQVLTDLLFTNIIKQMKEQMNSVFQTTGVCQEQNKQQQGDY